MNLKKILLSLIVIMVFVVFMLAQSAVYATTLQSGQEIYMGITELMTNDTPNMGYAIGKPGTDGAAKIWNIVKYKSATSSEYDDGNIYCVKAGVGFTETDSGTIKRAAYNVFYDMKTERDAIKAQNEILKDLVEKTITVNGTTINRYDAVLAILDMLYLPGESTAEEKAALIDTILQCAMYDSNYSAYTPYVELMQEYPLTDSDINAVQQAAIWYFTNYEEENGKYDKTGNKSWLNYTLDGTTYDTLANYTPNGQQPQYDAGQARSYQSEILYNYMIEQAIANANKYTNSSSTAGAPVRVDTTTLNGTESGDNYVIGPIHMTELNSTPYTIDFKVKNNETEISNYQLLDENQNAVSNGTTVKSLVGKDFYISVPKSSATSITIDITVNYNNTTITLWASSTNNQEQPLVEIKKEPKKETVELTFKPEEPEEPEEKPFDLALRKYITKVNGVELTGASSRVPNIDESTLTSGTTATYKHKKDPVTIATGDKVTYKMTIYNEGEKAGRATKVVDQLPTGLQFTQVVSGNFELDNYDETTNTLSLIRKANNTDNLPAYTNGNLSEETIEIECTVTATPDTANSKILTNVAWISEEFDAEDNKTIINEKGDDRDSEPGTYPDVNKDNMSNYTGNDNKTDLSDSDYYYKGQQDDDDFEKLVLLPESFDLKLIKRITAVNNQNVPERIESIDASKLNTLDANGNMTTTADYELNKEPVKVNKGDIVTYTFRIYNEGTIDGYAQEITEDVPEGLQFLWSEKEGEELQADTRLTAEEKEAIEFNQKYLWGKFVYDDAKENIIQISSDYLSKENETTVGGNLITAFGKNDGTKTESDLDYKEISVKFKVVSENVAGTIIRNEAAITEDCDKNGDPVDDRDSETDKWVKYEDDEDYDNIILQAFDLALRKFIIAVSEDTKIENNEYLKNEDGSYTRAPVVDTSKLNTLDENGKLITTATYNHTKEPVALTQNDIVIYMLRVYNEGDIDGYASEIKDHLPPYLEFVEDEFNEKYGWEVSEDGRTVTTRYLENSLINKAQTDEDGKIVLSYKELPIMCKVSESAKTGENITNIADITEYLDENKESIADRDSQEDNVELPSDDQLPEYKDDETGSYVPGQQDDDDFEKVIIKPFDLALRKFITQVEEKTVDTRIPEVKYDKENNQISYEHTKEPVNVVTGNTVIYTIRIFNEGQRDGYAAQVLDDIPEGLEFLPENETNTTYRWKMYRALKDGETASEVTGATIVQDDITYVETTEVEEAEVIVTDYLSKEQGEARMEEDEELTQNPNLLKAFNQDLGISETNPDYKDVKVAFKVVEPNTSDNIIVNSAQISEDTDENGNPIDDDDSIPGKWNEGEDDQDKEYIKLNYFDLALRKWVTQAIVIENGKETITQTGHDAWDDPEAVVKVELHRKKLNQVTVKFRYSIRVYNQGDIEGYAKEVTDYVPEGLKFVAEDNPGWTDEGNNVISTRLLENTLLKPGEYADVEVVLTWINNENNMGVMTNIAEISEDYNEYGVPDIDSTPDNKKDGEDDIDDAPVMLSISTGQIRIYFTLGFIVLITIAGGVVLIKKYVL